MKKIILVFTMITALLCGCGKTSKDNNEEKKTTISTEEEILNSETAISTEEEMFNSETAITTEEEILNNDTESDDSNTTSEDPFAGLYYEEIAGRGEIEVTNNGDNTYNVYIRWAGSAFEYGTWEFSGEFDGRQVLNYTNCVNKHIICDENGNETVETEYTDGTGYIKITDEGLFWQDDQDGAGDDTKFIKN